MAESGTTMTRTKQGEARRVDTTGDDAGGGWINVVRRRPPRRRRNNKNNNKHSHHNHRAFLPLVTSTATATSTATGPDRAHGRRSVRRASSSASDDEPVKSYGIIAVRVLDRDDAAGGGAPPHHQVCLVRREWSLSMCDVIYGQSDLEAAYFKRLVRGMTRHERQMLLQKSPMIQYYQRIMEAYEREGVSRRRWRKMLWRKNRVQRRIDHIHNGSGLLKVLSDVKSRHKEPEWEFPKGRPFAKLETPLSCAVREFGEETGYAPDDYDLVSPDHVRFVEEYVGSNGVRYRHVYFLALMRDPHKEPAFDARAPGPGQRFEISAVEWIPVATARKRIRSSQYTKRRCMDQIRAFVGAHDVRTCVSPPSPAPAPSPSPAPSDSDGSEDAPVVDDGPIPTTAATTTAAATPS